MKYKLIRCVIKKTSKRKDRVIMKTIKAIPMPTQPPRHPPPRHHTLNAWNHNIRPWSYFFLLQIPNFSILPNRISYTESIISEGENRAHAPKTPFNIRFQTLMPIHQNHHFFPGSPIQRGVNIPSLLMRHGWFRNRCILSTHYTPKGRAEWRNQSIHECRSEYRCRP